MAGKKIVVGKWKQSLIVTVALLSVSNFFMDGVGVAKRRILFFVFRTEQ